MDLRTRKKGFKQLMVTILAMATVALMAIPMTAAAQENIEKGYGPNDRFETRKDEQYRSDTSNGYDEAYDEFYRDEYRGYYEKDEGMFEKEGVFENERFKDEGFEEPTFDDWEYGDSEDYFTDDWFEEENEFNTWYD